LSQDEKTPLPFVKRPPLDSTRACFWREVYMAAVRAGAKLPEVTADRALQQHDLRFRHEDP